jgi:predicted secreted hydrolase
MNNDMKKMSRSFPFYSKYTLKENDEGQHHNSFFKLQEWWYYNVLFNNSESELKNWTVAISFCTFSHTDSIKLVLHDDKQKSYGDIYLKPVGTCKTKRSGVNVNLNSSYAIGQYPKWHVYADNKNLDNPEITVDLDFKANSLPIWLLKNTGFNLSTSPFGYYCIMNCDVKGEISVDDRVYKVKGLGYHDHTWMPSLKETEIKHKEKLIDFNIWDWLCIHFDNGWDVFIGKIHSYQRFAFSNLIPGSLCISPNGKESVECNFFPLEFIEYTDSSIPSLKIPTKIHIKALKMNLLRKKPLKGPFFLDIYYEAENIKECIPRDPPTWCQWETTGKVYGEIRGFRKKIKLNGWGMMETTSNI